MFVKAHPFISIFLLSVFYALSGLYVLLEANYFFVHKFPREPFFILLSHTSYVLFKLWAFPSFRIFEVVQILNSASASAQFEHELQIICEFVCKCECLCVCACVFVLGSVSVLVCVYLCACVFVCE